MKKKNYKCCGRKYSELNSKKFNFKCLFCKKNNKKNKALVCACDWHMGEKHQGLIQKQNTSYIDDHLNYIICCDHYIEEINEYWDERWQDYYSSR